MVEATPEMAKYCFAVISSQLKREAIPTVPQSIPNEPCPVFVSLKTIDGALRGCIGTFTADPLHEQLKNYAIAAACEDSRFNPVELSELPSLSCTVYVLHSFEKAADWKDWVIGVHGIRITYKSYSATFLPSVMSEEGWNHEQTLRHLLRKAGYGGDVTESVLDKVYVTRYQESKASIDFLSIVPGN
ncbi:ammecr1 [Trypanosoma rangeli]|uniref:Ammecr1 n=1 Tax=Trypanosoma rangeli TaxID=5698 RepID=A0A422NJL2_TRYRA|nr:ammecr1 [Trypanosoma rangeli]RNF05641.1 ammecr1 [Trypanosoma rangeli]|eukprot:RNF05641.1 ammecr1 [Trypanosoma rangeli]